jgi:hypothetical protein
MQQGPVELAAYREQIILRDDISLTYEILSKTPTGGIAHWNVTYQVASAELFRI